MTEGPEIEETRKLIGETTEKMFLNLLILQSCLSENGLKLTESPETFISKINLASLYKIHACKDISADYFLTQIGKRKLEKKKKRDESRL